MRVHDSQAYQKMDVTTERISCILELRVFINNGKTLWGCADRTVRLNTPSVVYFPCLSGQSCLLVRGQCSVRQIRDHKPGTPATIHQHDWSFLMCSKIKHNTKITISAFISACSAEWRKFQHSQECQQSDTGSHLSKHQAAGSHSIH